MLRTYETMYITSTDVDKSVFESIHAKVTDFITKSGGEIFIDEDLGVKRLAYQIDKQKNGNYRYLAFTADANIIKDIEFQMKISEAIMRFVTVKVDDIANTDAVQKPNVRNLN